MGLAESVKAMQTAMTATL